MGPGVRYSVLTPNLQGLNAALAAPRAQWPDEIVVLDLGAEKIIQYRQQDFVAETLAWTGGKGADVVFDTVGGDTYLRSLHAACIYGKVVSLLSTPLSLADTQTARLRNLSTTWRCGLRRTRAAHRA